MHKTKGSPSAFHASLKAARRIALTSILLTLTVGFAQADYTRAARIDSTVTPEGSIYQYNFTLVNTSLMGIQNTSLATNLWFPLFNLNDVANISSPQNWSYEFVTPNGSSAYYNSPTAPYGDYKWTYSPANDPTLARFPNLYVHPDAFIAPPFLIHWFTVANPVGGGPLNSVGVGQMLSGFGFTSKYGGAPAPYLNGWNQESPTIGDPPLPGVKTAQSITPDSPAYQQAVIPEPGSIAALAFGFSGLLLRLRRRR